MKFIFRRNVQENRHETGVWVSLDDEKYNYQLVIDDPKDGPAVKVASRESRAWKSIFQAGVEKHAKLIRAKGNLPDQIADPLEDQCLTAVTLDWIGVTDEDGAIVPFSKASVLAFLQTSKLFRNRIREVANDLAAFEREAVEDDIKNSPSTSPTNLNGAVQTDTDQPGTTPLH